MTYQEALRQGVEQLKRVNLPSADLDAEVLLSLVVKKPKEFVLTYPEEKLTAGQRKKFSVLIRRRQKFEPVAYLTGHQEFYGLDFKVNKNVLIPRPETELLVEEVIGYIKKTKKQESKKTRKQKSKIKILDIGTGSGAIAIALKKNLPPVNVSATDISRRALAVARQNAKLNRVNINFIRADLLDKIDAKNFDIIVANLPYLPNKNKKSRSPLTRPLAYEPAAALYGGQYGLDEYARLFAQIKKAAIKPLIMFFEIGDEYATRAKRLAQINFPGQQVLIKKDLCGRERLLVIKS